MTPILLSFQDLAIAASVVVLDAALSLWFGLGLHRRLLVASVRLVLQLFAIGLVLRWLFASPAPIFTLLVVLAMGAAAIYESTSRTDRRLRGLPRFVNATGAVALPTLLVVVLALTTAIRPQPWYDPRYAVMLVGIVLGNVMNAASLATNAYFNGVVRARPGIEARLALGADRWTALGPVVRESIRVGLLPIVNQMAAAGIITLPGIMTGQILAGFDPVEAVKYQILLMFLLAGGGGLAAVIAAHLAAYRTTDARHRLRLDRLATAGTAQLGA
jgi:putative ABC transport system permease protein